MLIEARRTETDGGHAQYRRPLLKLLDIFTRQRVNDWSPRVNATPQERLIASFGQREMVTQGGSVEADLARSATTCLTRSSVISELRHSMKGRSVLVREEATRGRPPAPIQAAQSTHRVARRSYAVHDQPSHVSRSTIRRDSRKLPAKRSPCLT